MVWPCRGVGTALAPVSRHSQAWCSQGRAPDLGTVLIKLLEEPLGFTLPSRRGIWASGRQAVLPLQHPACHRSQALPRLAPALAPFLGRRSLPAAGRLRSCYGCSSGIAKASCRGLCPAPPPSPAPSWGIGQPIQGRVTLGMAPSPGPCRGGTAPSPAGVPHCRPVAHLPGSELLQVPRIPQGLRLLQQPRAGAWRISTGWWLPSPVAPLHPELPEAPPWKLWPSVQGESAFVRLEGTQIHKAPWTRWQHPTRGLALQDAPQLVGPPGCTLRAAATGDGSSLVPSSMGRTPRPRTVEGQTSCPWCPVLPFWLPFKREHPPVFPQLPQAGTRLCLG